MSDQSEKDVVARIKFYSKNEPLVHDDVCTWRHEIEDYFRAVPVNFSCKLDLFRATEFQINVWKHTALIPYGEVRSYQWIAMKLGNKFASRAVGQALAQNPVPIIIPCHRVIYSNGRVGGFCGKADASKIKRMLLNLEGVKLTEDTRYV